jgi:hypothetical protein
VNRYRPGGSWKTQTIILCGAGPADEKGHRDGDRPIAFVDSAAPEGVAELAALMLTAAALDPELVRLARGIVARADG